MVEVRLETSKLVLFVRKQTIRIAIIVFYQEKWKEKISSINFGNHQFSGKNTRRGNHEKEVYHRKRESFENKKRFSLATKSKA